MKWLHWRIRSVVPLICAGAWRASSIVRREPPATPAPATVRNFRRLRVEVLTGRGTWRATLFLVRPGNLADGARLGQRSDQYLFDIIKNGGAPIGRPGMPAFGAALSEDEIRELVAYVRELSRAR